MTDVAPGYEASIIWLKFEFSGKIQQFGKYQVPEFHLEVLSFCFCKYVRMMLLKVLVFVIHKQICYNDIQNVIELGPNMSIICQGLNCAILKLQ